MPVGPSAFAPECARFHLAVREHQSVSAECGKAKCDWFIFHFGLEWPGGGSISADAGYTEPQNTIRLQTQHLLKWIWSTTFYILTFLPDICWRFNVSLNGKHHNYYFIEFVFSVFHHFWEPKAKFREILHPKSKMYDITLRKEACCFSLILLNKKETIMLA